MTVTAGIVKPHPTNDLHPKIMHLLIDSEHTACGKTTNETTGAFSTYQKFATCPDCIAGWLPLTPEPRAATSPIAIDKYRATLKRHNIALCRLNDYATLTIQEARQLLTLMNPPEYSMVDSYVPFGCKSPLQ